MNSIKNTLKRNAKIRQWYSDLVGKRTARKRTKEGQKIYKRNLNSYMYQYRNLKECHGSFEFNKEYATPCYCDRFAQNGRLDQYFWQDLWAARQIASRKPKEHYDIGSSVGGFIAHLASFRDCIHLIDIRPMDAGIPGVSFVQADATNLNGIDDESIDSLSALCSLEHFGLGRYGDEVSPDSWYKAIRSIVRVVSHGGYAYIAVPIGWEHLEFDAHRVFYASTIVDSFKPMELVEYSCISGDDLCIEKDVPIHKYDECKDYDSLRFGLFCFRKD